MYDGPNWGPLLSDVLKHTFWHVQGTWNTKMYVMSHVADSWPWPRREAEMYSGVG